MKDLMNLEELQEKVGLLDNDQGIVYLSLLDTDLYDLLSSYIETVDYRLYFDFSNRIVIKKYANLVSASKLSLVKKAVYYALKGEEYNLKTLINTTNLDYNPLENYEIHETIKTTASIAGAVVHGAMNTTETKTSNPYTDKIESIYGEHTDTDNITYGEHTDTENVIYGESNDVTTTSIGAYTERIEKSTPAYSVTTTESHSQYSETNTSEDELKTEAQVNGEDTTTTFGEAVTSGNSSTTVGERSNTDNNEHTVSAYNTTTYQPSSKDTNTSTSQTATDSTTTSSTAQSHIDSEDKNITIGPRNETRNVTTTKEIPEFNVNTVQNHTSHEDVDMHNHSGREDNQKVTHSSKTDSHTKEFGTKTDTHSKSFGAETDSQTQTHDEQKSENITLVNEHTVSNDESQNQDKQRDLHGRYGFNTVQTMIESERRLANLDIADTIIDIVIHTICEGVLYLW